MNDKPQIDAIVPLLPLQRGMLFHAVAASGAGDDPYILQVSGRIDGALEPAHVQAAWQTLFERHPALRCAFIHKGQSEPRQAVLHTLAPAITTLDWRADDSAAGERRLAELKAAELAAPFNLQRPPLLRFTLVRRGPQAWDFILTHHHIVLDGWSQSLLVAELYELIDAAAGARATRLAAPPDFAHVLRTMHGRRRDDDEAFWRQMFAGWRTPGLTLAPSSLQSASAPAARPCVTLDGELVRRLLETGRGRRITPATLCQMAWSLVLARHTASRDVVYGVTVSGRGDDAAALGAVGMFVNTVPLRIVLDPAKNLADLALGLKQRMHELEQRSYCDLGEIQRWAGVEQGAPLLQSLVAFENFPLSQLQPDGRLRLSALASSERTSLPLALVIVPGEQWTAALQTDTSRIEAERARAMLGDFVAALASVTQSWLVPLGQVLDQLASPPWSDAAAAVAPASANLLEAWQASVLAHGARTALRCGDSVQSYAELDRAADGVALALQARGVVAGSRVAICATRGWRMLAAMLGALKAGATYVPLDPANPADRLGWILSDARPAVLLADAPAAGAAAAGLAGAGLPAGVLLALETVAPATDARPLPCAVAANAPAYVIYTSGSTGRPKGVLVTHDNVLQLFAATPACVAAGPEDRWTLFHSFAFDFSVWEIWGPWLSGGECVIVPLEVARDPAAMVALVRERGITVLSQTPSAFGLFAAAERQLAQPLTTLRWLVFGGEALTLAALDGWVRRHGDQAPRLINMYGITETTVHVTWRRILAQDLQAGRGSVIGGALPHLAMTLMDGDGRPVPDGVAGEIWVGGAGVSAGYLNQPALTAERFVPDAFSARPGQRAYRSGDLARRGADGETDYLGRIDQQVKIRGHRIELGEIEQALLALPEVGAACVGTYRKEPQGDPSLLGLCAWVVPRAPNEAAADALRAALAARLPAYMLPDALLLVERIALTLNGKADRGALPDPATRRDTGVITAPRNQREQLLCQAMAQALGLDAVGIDDNYFALGGDSIRSLRFASTAQALGVPFALRSLFEAPSVRALAATLDAAAVVPAAVAAPVRAPFGGIDAAERAVLPAGAADAFPLSRLQAGMLFHADFGEEEGLYLDLVSNRLDRLLEHAAFERAVSVLAARHPALRTSFHLSGARPLQVVHADASLRVDWCDLRDLSPALARARIVRQDEALRVQPYVLEQPGLLRLRVSELADGTCWLSMAIHHAILDGWSVALLSAELLALYGAACDGSLQAGAPADTEMADFVAREQNLMQAPAAGDFWRARLAALPASQLPRWGEAGGERPRHVLALAPDTGAQLAALCAASGLPAKAWLLGLVAQVLGWNAGEPAFTVGLVVNGRAQSAGGAAALGLFLNTIPLALPARGSWRALAGAAFRADAETYDWRNYPLADMVRLHGGRKPFEINLNFVHFRPLAGVQRSSGIGVIESLSSESTELPLTINFGIDPDSGALTGQLVANASFSAAQVAALAAQLACGLRRLLQAPDALADCASEAERDWSLRRFNPPQDAPAFTPLPLRVLRRLRAAPSATALVDADGVAWQGAELIERVESIAALLLQAGVQAQQPVAVYQGRSLDAVASQVAIAALGAWYVPLDTEAPPQRIAAILADLGAPLLLADRPFDVALAQRCTPLQVAMAGAGHGAAPALEQLAARIAPQAAAYAIYTSGSSGAPKGVQIGHAAWANHMAWMGARFEFGPRDRILHRTRASFDASVWEIWAPLDSGAVLVLAGADASVDPGALLRTIERQRISVAQVVPSLLEALPGDPGEAALDRLRLLFAGGEVLRRQAALAIIGGRQLQLVNLYGPTETTIDATFEVVDAGRALRSDSGVMPIGLPIDGVSAVVVDQDLRPLPVGATGELLLGGAAVGLAYLGQPALTAERFVPDPHGAAGSRAFLTRDLVRRLADGRLEFVGRLDRQVKIGGNRIELGEIEVALAQLTDGRRCAIEAETPAGGTRRLVAYVERGGQLDAAAPASLRAALMRQLPGYMVPALVRLVDHWPLMASGKTDRAALAGAAASEVADAPAAPCAARHDDNAAAGSLQALLASEVGSLLGLSTVGLDDDFFSIGGDSISAMQLVSRARRLGVTLSAGDIFKLRSVRQMALATLPPAPLQAPAAPAAAAAHWPLLPIQHWYFDLQLANPHWYHQTVALRPRARYPLAQVEAALRTLGQRHDAFAARFGAGADDAARGDGAPLLRHCDSAESGQLHAAAAALQAATRLDRGPLWGAVLASSDGVTLDALVVAAHHIAVDGVSWRILLDELALLLAGAALPPPATTLADAALLLQAWQPQPAERQHWDALLETLRQGRSDTVTPAGLQGDSVSAACALTPEETAQLLARAGDHWHASTEELLLAALMQASAGMPLRQDTLVLVEGHGRDVVDGADLARTVGWFTTQRPLPLPAAPASPQEAVRQAKMRLRAIPAAGAGWLRLCREQPGVAGDDGIVFNYLGRFDGTIGAGDAPFEALDIALPPASDPANRRSSLLDLVAVIEGQCLRLAIEADGSRVGTAQAEQLALQLRAALLCLAQPDREQVSLAWLASDFPLAGLAGESELQALLASHPATRQLLPCTPVQQGMVFDQQLHANAGGHYIQQLEITLSAAPDALRLEQAFQALVARHDTLRTAFAHGEGGRLLQLVQAQAALPFEVLDLRGRDDPGAAWRTLLADDRARGFVLAEAPLARATLARLGEHEWRLLWSHHHLLADGWSQPVLLGELVALYHQAPLPAPVAVPASYWRWLEQVDESALRQRWQRRFAGFEAATLVAASTLAAAPEAPLVLALDTADSTRLQQFCRAHGLTLAAVIQAAWALMLGKMLHVDDVAFGMVVSGRPAGIAGSAEWVGMFINTLPVRVALEGSAELLPWLAGIQQEMADIADSAHLPLPRIQSWVNQGRPLFDSIVVFENYPLQSLAPEHGDALALAGVTAHEVNEYPLSLYVEPGASLSLSLRHDAGRFATRCVRAMGEGVLQALRAWSSGAVRQLGATQVLDAAARMLAQDAGHGPQLAAPDVIAAIVRQAAQTPHALALEDGGDARYSYAALLEQARRLAGALAAHGVGPGARVAVLAEHRAPLLLALLAAQLAGACFIPLDPTFPAERLGMILDDCRPQLVLHDHLNRDHAALAGQTAAAIEALLEHDGAAPPSGLDGLERLDGLAYILFTSGSTGRPKGVQIGRRAFANALASFAVAPGLDSGDVFGAATTVSFDIAMLELFLPLTVGARLVMIDKPVARDGMRLAALLAARGVTVFQGTPSTWKLLCAADAQLALRAWCGGEQLPQALCDELLRRFGALWNLYGPTETTIWSAVQRQQRGQAVGAGRPVANTSIFLTDPHGQLAPDGAIGEICIGGDGVMRGYLGRPDLSAAAFLPDLLRHGGALAYRTGDLGAWRADGTLAVLGRRDRQMKLDGFRIEPGDIEAALRALDGVADAAVMLHAGGGAPLLVAYVVLPGVDAAGQQPALRQLAGQLAGKLPRYMMPGRFVPLPALPLTLNGKLDQRALPAPDWSRQPAPSRQPEGALEKVVLQAWRQAFGREDIGPDDDFFAIGGHSFIATRIHAQLARVLRGKVPLSQIFEASTVARLAAAIVAHEGAAGEAMRLAQATLAVQAMTPEARAALRARAQR